ncbi:hypothetical protein [Candidatus Nitrosocosmicus franklandus]|uniref:Uncharacterized protein n=1 Tax=Candidatus Nitrosocosmicus franklandianus TaxID=1798806 RepID=A0A484IAS7_9ARCH|nr:hypothetical protein [Candidatus Nitrosocosmicus franklandus]VFJ14853.1 conserved protein of unknown function [Candidatus Nitrosocosmicus franklandus]
MELEKKHYENKELGISFDYPSDWFEITDESIMSFGADVLIHSDSVIFGFKRVYLRITSDVPFEMIIKKVLKDTIYPEETILEESQLDKYPIRNGRSGTVIVKRSYGDKNIVLHERTFIINDNRDSCFITLFEQDQENTKSLDSLNIQKQLEEIYESFKFL